MDLKFSTLLNNFFPKGKFWEMQENITKVIDGTSDEFNRIYQKSKTFYQDFNIIESFELADKHAEDYLISKNIYTNAELQRIIVDYLNKDETLKEVIMDFANFINTPIEFGAITNPFMAGRSTAGNALGDPLYNNARMILYIKFLDINDVNNIRKIKDLVAYLKPPYLNVIYNTTNDVQNIPFITGRNTTGNPLGQILT